MRRIGLTLLAILLSTATHAAEDRFPAPEFRSDYKLPPTETAPPPLKALDVIDVAVLVTALSIGTYLVLKRRSRRGVFVLMLASLLYFGFYREGCVCPIGATQNVALAASTGSALPWIIAVFFALPLLFALFFGRIFCAAVCPLGAIQDVVLWRPVRVPEWLEHALGLVPWIYLGLAVLYATVGTEFVICRYDPFVGFFRMSGPAHMLMFGGLLLLLGLFVGRPYCRFLCPYSVLLRSLSVVSRHRVSITPKNCIDCRLCEQSCPFGAIREPVQRPAKKALAPIRRRLLSAALATPIIMGALGLVGYAAGPALASREFTVRLAEQVDRDEQGLITTVSDEVKAFRGTGGVPAQLYEQARRIRRNFTIGGTILGAFIGLVVGLKIIHAVIQRGREGYTADPGACLACARCYASCPVGTPVELTIEQGKKEEEKELVEDVEGVAV